MTTRTGLSVLAAVAAVVLASGCATLPPPRPGDALFEVGDFAAAVTAYEDVVRRRPETLIEDPELGYRLAWARAVPGHEGSDPARARELLEPLLGQPSHRARATALLALLAELDEVRRRTEELMTEVSALEARLRQGDAVIATCETRLAAEAERAAALEARAEALAAREKRLAAELEAIKRIDLAPPP